MMHKRSNNRFDAAPAVAGNGLIDRRALLGRGVAVAGAIGTGVGPLLTGAAAEPLSVPRWSKEPGGPFVGYGQPSQFEASVAREPFNPPNEPGSGVAFSPIHLLDGMITPNGLHFERSHGGIPEINPDTISTIQRSCHFEAPLLASIGVRCAIAMPGPARSAARSAPTRLRCGPSMSFFQLPTPAASGPRQ
jgi:hypothetical protein